MAFLDWLVLLIYGGIIVGIGIRAGRKEETVDDYFLGGRRMPWWAVMVSIYATSLSALTFIGVPGAAFAGDFHYLQLGIGDLVGRILIAWLFLVPFYRGNVTTVYELLGQRFGPRSHDAGTIFFLVTRLLASGVRLAGCAIALAVVFRIPLNAAICGIAILAMIYTCIGGIKAVIWTDLVQFILLTGAALVVIGTVIALIPGGFSELLEISRHHEKFRVLHFSFDSNHADYWLNFGNPQALGAGLVFGCLSTFAALGTDQDLVQRMLTCKHVKESQKALLLSAILNFPMTLLFLSVGAALFAYYTVFPDATVTAMTQAREFDKVFPFFIQSVLAPGLRGLLIAGLLAAAMSSLDSALNALASTSYVDLVQRYWPNDIGDAHAVRISRLLVAVFTAALALIAIAFSHTESILWLGFRIVGYTYGALLGIFLLAVLTKDRGHDIVNLLAMISSVAIVMLLTSDSVGVFAPVRSVILRPLGISQVAWPWAIAIGSAWTFGISFSFRSKRQEQDGQFEIINRTTGSDAL